MPQFTAANARLFAARAVEKRQQLALYRQTPPDQSPVLPDQNSKEVATDTLDHFRNISRRLRESTRMPPDEVDALTRSMERVWKIHAHAAQIPQPAHRKEQRKRSGETIDLEPMPIAVLPDASAMVPMDVTDKAEPHHDSSSDQPQPDTMTADDVAGLFKPNLPPG